MMEYIYVASVESLAQSLRKHLIILAHIVTTEKAEFIIQDIIRLIAVMLNLKLMKL